MNFEYVQEIFQYYPECLIHPVSCQGICHQILSKQIKKTYPEYFREYTRFCARKKLSPGQAYFYPLNLLFGSQFIVTLTIKNKWQEKIHPDVFKPALEKLIQKSVELKLTTIGIPNIDGVPHDWLIEQFKKTELIENNTIKNVIFFPN